MSRLGGGKPYPPEKIAEAFQVYMLTGNKSEAARKIGVPPKTIHKWSKQYRWSEQIQNAEGRLLANHADRILRLKRQHLEVAEQLLEEIRVRLTRGESPVTYKDFIALSKHCLELLGAYGSKHTVAGHNIHLNLQDTSRDRAVAILTVIDRARKSIEGARDRRSSSGDQEVTGEDDTTDGRGALPMAVSCSGGEDSEESSVPPP